MELLFPRLVKVLTSAAALPVALALTPFIAGPADAADQVRRSAGSERIATSVAASADHRKSAENALLATAGSFPDALAAGALAAGLDAPLLLTHGTDLPDQVSSELDRLGVDKVWVLGGSAVISSGVTKELRASGHEVERIAGDSRFETARQIALKAGPSKGGEVVVALGSHPEPERAWPDAVASGALAASPDRLPTLLTAHDQLPPATAQGLKDLGARKVLLIGGESAIEPAVERRIRDLGYPVERVAGTSRYETSVELAEDALARNGQDDRRVVFATGSDFPDALAAGALAGNLGSPLVLIPSESLAGSVDRFLRENVDRWGGGVVVGGQSAASDFVVAQLTAAVNGQPAPKPPAPKAAPKAADKVVGAFEGRASWYGPGFHGRPTASGQRFDRNALTAAHRTLPFGTRVRVTNLNNGAQVTVRINDRGPFHGGRVIDLAEAAARHIGMTASGTAPVRGEILAD